MFQHYEDVFLRDISMIFAATIGIILLGWFYMRNSNLVDYFFKKPKALITKEKKWDGAQELSYANLDWHGQWCDAHFTQRLQEPKAIWQIGVFHCQRIEKERDFSFGMQIPWFEFSKTGLPVESIMSPIFRKIFAKYKSKFERVNFVRKSFGKPIELYTWLRNETHIRTAVFAFLDEVLRLCEQYGLSPRLTITMEEIVTLEVFFPKAGGSPLSELDELMGVEYREEEHLGMLKLWVAFSLSKAPNSFELPTLKPAFHIAHEGVLRYSNVS